MLPSFDSKVKVMGQSSRSLDEPTPFSSVRACYEVTYLMDSRYNMTYFCLFVEFFALK